MAKKVQVQKVDPKVKDVLVLLGLGTFLAASIVMPGLPLLAKEVLKVSQEMQREKRQKEWEKFNGWRLRQVIKRMQGTKYVEVVEEDGIPIVKITERGRKKLLSCNLEEMKLNESRWDGKWRLIIYDVASKKRSNSELFRRALQKLNLYKLQKSVYLTPFECEGEIEYLRHLFDVGNEVIILKVGNLEYEQAYRRYFGI